jgi:hypothetical protein
MSLVPLKFIYSQYSIKSNICQISLLFFGEWRGSKLGGGEPDETLHRYFA